MNGNALSELNPSGSDLILNSYFSLLAHFSYMVIARPINVSVYNCVYVSVSVCHGRLASRDKEGDNTLELKELHLLK